MSKNLLDISELSIKLNLINKKTGKPANHIIRFWEKEFTQIKPLILKGNRRYYDNNQVQKIKFIKYLLKDKGLTIKGAKKILKSKKNIDESEVNNISKEYFKNTLKLKTKKILKKIKTLKSYG